MDGTHPRGSLATGRPPPLTAAKVLAPARWRRAHLVLRVRHDGA